MNRRTFLGALLGTAAAPVLGKALAVPPAGAGVEALSPVRRALRPFLRRLPARYRPDWVECRVTLPDNVLVDSFEGIDTSAAVRALANKIDQELIAQFKAQYEGQDHA
jgi:hypothetical protein